MFAIACEKNDCACHIACEEKGRRDLSLAARPHRAPLLPCSRQALAIMSLKLVWKAAVGKLVWDKPIWKKTILENRWWQK